MYKTWFHRMKEATSPYKANEALIEGADVKAGFTNPADKIFVEEKETKPEVKHMQNRNKEETSPTIASQIEALEKQLETEKDATKIEEINKQITELRAKLENKSEEE